ncbi:hypothetical protein ACRAWG_21450 [Methylobacterium sp. P31]
MTAAGVASAMLLLAPIAAIAAQAAKEPAETKVADAGPQVRPAAVVEREEDATCSRARRRLWIEGEGWVVRRITTCR